ncbi:hypothetical protein EW145_g5854 [Phellinidium pouzarii]|uniref:Uncharacterized protein n=1 Tax=Phellinidium pouzarii TaxID=167371 RepID=A0A4S4KYI9_9AGAM|nr:hypothetical protein EW145_g5854 [Phellinidium pouzarii]
MSNSAFPTAPGRPSSSATSQRPQAAAQQQHQTSGIYSFSVHQPYTNWPLHASTPAPYAPSWYALPAQAYSPPKTYRETETQTLAPYEDPGARRDRKEENEKYKKHWDAAFSAFFKRVGLYQTLSGFHEDMLLLNADWERKEVPAALQALVQDISDTKKDGFPDNPLEERKLQYVHAQKGVKAQSPSTNIKSISRLLRQSSRRNNTSNRAEFLHSVAEKRRKLNELGQLSPTPVTAALTANDSGSNEAGSDVMDTDNPGASTSKNDGASASVGDAETVTQDSISSTVDIPSCARVDAKPQNRDVQMKYDIAKNEDGPLKRTMKQFGKSGGDDHPSSNNGKVAGMSMEVKSSTRVPTVERHPGLSERFASIETHLACLEEHVINLEKDYPPWAALHFNQPNRGWPPPPRLTPIIVAPHHVSTTTNDSGTTTSAALPHNTNLDRHTYEMPAGSIRPGGSAKTKPAQSSLHRAVLEKLEIQRAMGDLAGGSDLANNGG